MIPLRDLNPTHSRPVVTWIILAGNVLAFLAVSVGASPDALQEAATRFGAVAYHFTGQTPEAFYVPDLYGRPMLVEPIPRDGWWPLRAFTHMWMHGGWMHLIGNMWFLHVFGDNVEDRLGRPRFVALYLIGGMGALVAQVVADPASGVPMVGASGAVAGVLGAYLRLFPHARVLALVPIGFLFMTFVWPAFAFLGIWIAMQILNAAVDHGSVGGGVAWFAHIGGFALGWLLARPMARPEPKRVHVEFGRDARRADRFRR